MATIPFNQRLGYTVDEAVNGGGISRSSLYNLMNDGTLKSKIIHGRRIIDGESYRRLICADGGGEKSASPAA